MGPRAPARTQRRQPGRTAARVRRSCAAAEGRPGRRPALRPGTGQHARRPQRRQRGPADVDRPAEDPPGQPVGRPGPGRGGIAHRPIHPGQCALRAAAA
nr:hypothetical protein [Stenotrophomonas sp. SbOxS2]